MSIRPMRKLFFNKGLDEDAGDSEATLLPAEYLLEPTEDKPANLISSQDMLREDCHYPVIDIDFPAFLIPSTTPDHFHLYIDKAVFWDDYKDLLDALVQCGIVQKGYAEASKQRGFTCVRLPWVTKKPKED